MLINTIRKLTRINPILLFALPVLAFWFVMALVSNVCVNIIRPNWLNE